MGNNSLDQLQKIVSSDDFDLRSGEMAKKLREKWELAEAAENLGEHLVIKNILKDLTDANIELSTFLETQEVMTDEDVKLRFKAQGQYAANQSIIDIFSGTQKIIVGHEIESALAKAKTLNNEP